MQNRIFRVVLWSLLVVWTGLVLYGSLAKNDDLPPVGWLTMIPYFDKLVHFGFYFGEATLLLLLFNISTRGRILIVASVILFSGFIEIVQPYLGRGGDSIDFLANTLGAIFGMVGASLINRFVVQKIIVKRADV